MSMMNNMKCDVFFFVSCLFISRESVEKYLRIPRGNFFLITYFPIVMDVGLV